MCADGRSQEAPRLAVTAPAVRASAPPAGIRAEAHFLRQLAAYCRVTGRKHMIIRWQPPARAVVLRRHAIGPLEMPAQHFQFLAVLKTDEIVVRY